MVTFIQSYILLVIYGPALYIINYDLLTVDTKATPIK